MSARKTGRCGPPCDACKQPMRKAKTKSETCTACRSAALAARKVCPSCGGYKAGDRAKVCLTCRLAARAAGRELYLVVGFIPAAFTEARQFAGWERAELARAARVSVTAIEAWEHGRAIPQRAVFQRVARILALEPCAGCGGSGWIDPSNPRVQRFLKRVTGIAS